MKIKKILFTLAVAGLLFLCLPSKKEEEKNSQKIPVATVNQVDKAADDNCFDQKMEKWFLAFENYQAQGYDMSSADKLSVKLAEQAYTECKNISSSSMASLSAEQDTEQESE